MPDGTTEAILYPLRNALHGDNKTRLECSPVHVSHLSAFCRKNLIFNSDTDRYSPFCLKFQSNPILVQEKVFKNLTKKCIRQTDTGQISD